MCHVLIIEDEALVAMLIEDVLLSEGATSSMVVSSEIEAIEAADRQPPDFIASDVMLTSGTGPAAVSAIRAIHGRIPTVFITALPADCEPCVPPDRVIAKPFSPQHVARAFHAMIDC